MSPLALRNIETADELRACEDLQIEVWGYTEREVVPNVAGPADQTTEEKTLPQLALHDALRPANKCHQQHDVEQRGMIRDD